MDTYREFETWRVSFINLLNASLRIAYRPFEDWDSLSDGQALAIKWQSAFEYWSDVLSAGGMKKQMEIFRDWKGVQNLCEQILSSSRAKLGTP